jgi:hypothetical protein
MLNSGCFSIAEVSVASMPLWCEQRSDVRSTRRCISHKQIGKLGHNADFEVIYFDTHACAYAIWQASRSPAALSTVKRILKCGAAAFRPHRVSALRSFSSELAIDMGAGPDAADTSAPASSG